MMLLLDDAGGGVEDAEGCFTLARLLGHAQLEEHGKQFRPWLVCPLFSNLSAAMPGLGEVETYSRLNIAFLLRRRCR